MIKIGGHSNISTMYSILIRKDMKKQIMDLCDEQVKCEDSEKCELSHPHAGEHMKTIKRKYRSQAHFVKTALQKLLDEEQKGGKNEQNIQ